MRCVATAPGKVLVTGGYLVLERAHTGLVVATDARFHTTAAVGTAPVRAGVAARSPQFGWARDYDVDEAADAVVRLRARASDGEHDGGANSYVETTLRNVISLAIAADPARTRDVLARGVAVEILGANDFYSQRDELARRGLPLTYDALGQLPAFCVSPDASLATVRKTGLGSSAALIASLTAALMGALGLVDWDADRDAARRFVHNVAQFCHCLAQGKVGSGFDVSSAVYGSHRYRRFSPACIEHLLAQAAVDSDASVPGPALLAALGPAAAGWDAEVTPLRLPPGVALLLGDVSAGSSTPSMVAKVNAWRAAQPVGAAKLWAELSAANDDAEALLRKLDTLHSDDAAGYDAALAHFASNAAEAAADAVTGTLAALRVASLTIRALLRAMGEAADVPIEPPAQTRLLNATMAVPGVVAAGVPGAGGYDAVYVLLVGTGARERVLALWAAWTEISVSPLLSSASSEGLELSCSNA